MPPPPPPHPSVPYPLSLCSILRLSSFPSPPLLFSISVSPCYVAHRRFGASFVQRLVFLVTHPPRSAGPAPDPPLCFTSLLQSVLYTPALGPAFRFGIHPCPSATWSLITHTIRIVQLHPSILSTHTGFTATSVFALLTPAHAAVYNLPPPNYFAVLTGRDVSITAVESSPSRCIFSAEAISTATSTPRTLHWYRFFTLLIIATRFEQAHRLLDSTWQPIDLTAGVACFGSPLSSSYPASPAASWLARYPSDPSVAFANSSTLPHACRASTPHLVFQALPTSATLHHALALSLALAANVLPTRLHQSNVSVHRQLPRRAHPRHRSTAILSRAWVNAPSALWQPWRSHTTSSLSHLSLHSA